MNAETISLDYQPTHERVGDTIKTARHTVNMSQIELSQATGVAQADISRLENGRSNPTVKTLERIAYALGCDVDIRFVPREKEE